AFAAAGRCSATNVPRPGRGTTSPSPASRDNARCTVTGEARCRAINSRTEGRRLPGGRARAAVRTSSITRDSVLPSIMSTRSNVTQRGGITQGELQDSCTCRQESLQQNGCGAECDAAGAAGETPLAVAPDRQRYSES